MTHENLPTEFDPVRAPAQQDPRVPWDVPPEIIVAAVVPEPLPEAEAQPRVRRRSWKWPLRLFVLTCLTTFLVGTASFGGFLNGLTYAACVMTILICHEMGHFIQTRRYGVYASYPIFLPMPIPPIGTLGAVIVMDSRMRDRKALFDIGITGPLAGLVPTLIFCVAGLWYGSHIDARANLAGSLEYGDPLLLKWLAWMRFGTIPSDYEVVVGPVSIAGWVGLLVTALNLVPIGQLDGGHISYALIRRRAHILAKTLLCLAIAIVFWDLYTKSYHYAGWSLMLVLLAFMGPRHPPTANDDVPLGGFRIVLGWLTLAFLVIGFTPEPFKL